MPDISHDRGSRWLRAVPLLMVLAVSGCGGEAPGEDTSGAEAPPETVSTATDPPDDAQTASPAAGQDEAASETGRPGDTLTIPRGSLVTVSGPVDAGRDEDAPAGTTWTAFDVEFCVSEQVVNDAQAVALRGEMRLRLESGAELFVDGTSTRPDEAFSQQGVNVAPGECLSGLVVFSVPDDDVAEAFLIDSPRGATTWHLSEG